MGHHSQPVGDGLFNRAFSFGGSADQFVDPRSIQIRAPGLFAGGVLGLLGLALTRWEQMPRTFRYTPNRWLILTITLAVTARVLYGFCVAGTPGVPTKSGTAWLAESGAAGSLAVGAIVLGYYLIYSAGVWRRLRRHRTHRPG